MSSRQFARLASSNFFHGFSMYAMYFGYGYKDGEYNQNNTKSNNIRLKKEDISAAQSKGNVVIGVGEKIYSVPSDFVNSHPGGAKVIKESNGYNIENIWNDHKEYNFHLTRDNVQDYLENYFLGLGSLPNMPSDKFSKLPALSAQLDPNIYYDHNRYNIEARKLKFNENNETEHFFIRDHSEYSLDHKNLSIKNLDGNKITLSNEDLRELPQTSVFQPIICAGAGRSRFDGKVSGTPWGIGGADAIGTMRAKGTSVNNLLDLLNIKLNNNPCLMIVTGSDGYDAVIHSDEFDKFYLASQKENGDDLSPIHGRERRLIGEGTPGFRNIKSVSNISFIPEYSQKQLDEILLSRLKNKMEMLNNRDRQILAACKNYDAYLIKDPVTKEPIGFNSYFPPSSVITKIKTNRSKNLTNINASGIAFCGENVIKKVVICMQDESNNKKCKKADIRTVPNSSNKFTFWDADFVNNTSENNHEIKLTSATVDTNKDKIKNRSSDSPFANFRGLYWHSSKDSVTVPVACKDSKDNSKVSSEDANAFKVFSEACKACEVFKDFKASSEAASYASSKE